MSPESSDTKNNPWNSQSELALEIESQSCPVDYGQLIADSSVLLLGENHGNNSISSIRTHLADQAKALRDAGITHYAIEAPPNEVFDRLNKGEQVDLNSVQLGPPMPNTNYEETIRAMVSEGIVVVPIDADQKTDQKSGEERNQHITNNIRKVLLNSPGAKIAVLIGGFHADRRRDNDVAHSLIEDGVSVTSVQFSGGDETKSPSSFLGATSQAGLYSKDFMMDLRHYKGMSGVVFGGGEAYDYVVHLAEHPKTTQTMSGFLGRLSL